MRLALHLLGALAASAALGWLAFAPVPARGPATHAPLLSAKARGENRESIHEDSAVSPIARERSLRSEAFPSGGRPIVNRFSAAPSTSTPAFAGFPELHAPLDFRAFPAQGGVRLAWRAHPQNPVEQLRYRIERWNPDGQLEAAWVQDGLERFDRLECEGVPYAYRVSAQLTRQLELGREEQELVRRSPAARTVVRLERRTTWEARLTADDSLLLTWGQPGNPARGPFSAIPGQPIGDTGWVLESWTKGETAVPVLARSPRFDELGRRIVVDGRPASRVREESRMRSFAILSLLDPCGNRLRENLFLAEEEPR